MSDMRPSLRAMRNSSGTGSIAPDKTASGATGGPTGATPEMMLLRGGTAADTGATGHTGQTMWHGHGHSAGSAPSAGTPPGSTRPAPRPGYRRWCGPSSAATPSACRPTRGESPAAFPAARAPVPSVLPPEGSVAPGSAAADGTATRPRPTPPYNTPAVIAQLITAARRRVRFTKIHCHVRAPSGARVCGVTSIVAYPQVVKSTLGAGDSVGSPVAEHGSLTADDHSKRSGHGPVHQA